MKTARQSWRNWSGTVRSTPREVVYPDNVQEVVSLIHRCREEGRNLRVVGSGHSFTPLVETNDVLVSLDRMQGIAEVDTARHVATVWAGTKLEALGEMLYQHGLAQENLGDINVQSLGGAIGTGTHGTGIQFGNLSTQVIGLTVVLGTGDIVHCSEDVNADLFKALQVSFGALGVIVKVKLRLVPAFTLRYESRRMKRDDCFRNLEHFRNNYRHFEFYCFPYSDIVQVKLMNETADEPTPNVLMKFLNQVVLENWAFATVSGMCRAFPVLCATASRFSAKTVPVMTESGRSHRLFATPRLVRFNEMEYNIPADSMTTVLHEIHECIENNRFAVHFPIECRFSNADDIWLSPAYGRESAYVAVHMYRPMPYEDYFRAMEEVFLRFDGRPHWGKLHNLRAAELQHRYPKWADFLRIRHAVDPQGVFLNRYLRELFGFADPERGAQVEVPLQHSVITPV